MNNLTPRRPLGLSDEQLDIVLDAAHQLDPAWRSRFLAGVVDRLLPCETVTDAQVESACLSVAVKMRSKGRQGSDEIDRQVEARCGTPSIRELRRA